jgi:hypothetical protein
LAWVAGCARRAQRGRCGVRREGERVVPGGLVVLDRRDIGRLARLDLRGDLFLTSHRADRRDAPGHCGVSGPTTAVRCAQSRRCRSRSQAGSRSACAVRARRHRPLIVCRVISCAWRSHLPPVWPPLSGRVASREASKCGLGGASGVSVEAWAGTADPGARFAVVAVGIDKGGARRDDVLGAAQLTSFPSRHVHRCR